MFDLDGNVICKARVMFMKVFYNSDCMANTVEEVWIAKSDVFGTALYLLADILHDHIVRNNTKFAVINRNNRAVRLSWYHEFDRKQLNLAATTSTYRLPMSETVYRLALDLELEATLGTGQPCTVLVLDNIERSDARYPTGLPFRYDTSIASALDRYADLAAEPLPAPDAQALFMATTWWEDFGPEQPDGRHRYYGDVPVGRPMLHGTPLKVAIYGTPSEIDV